MAGWCLCDGRNGSTIGVKERVFYSLPAGAMTMLYGGPQIVVQGIYAKHYGLSLTTIATILLIANLFDTVTDPVIGYYSDRWYARTGTRKPFVVAGGVFFIVGAYFLFTPPDNVSSSYFLIFLLVFFFGFTLFNIPHYAWGNEISNNTHSSTQLFTIRSILVTAGAMAFYGLPQLPFFSGTEFTPQVLQWAVIIAGVLLVPALYLCSGSVPSRFGSRKNSCTTRSLRQDVSSSNALVEIIFLLKSVKKNKPFLLFSGALFFAGLGSGSWSALLFIFVDVYLQMGECFSLMSLLGMSASALGMYLWALIAKRFGKIRAWIIATVFTAISILSMLFLSPNTTAFPLLTLIMVPAFIGSTSLSLFAPALLSDIVDYTKWKYNKEFAGSYFSAYFFIAKANVAIGGAIGLSLAGWYGFDPASSSHSQEAVWGLKLVSIWIPALALLLSIYFIYRQPIDARRHTIICKALARREQRSNLSSRNNLLDN